MAWAPFFIPTSTLNTIQEYLPMQHPFSNYNHQSPSADQLLLDLLTNRYSNARYSSRTIRDEDILDAVLDCMIRLYIEKKLDAGRTENEIYSFIHTSIKNAVMDHGRQKKRRQDNMQYQEWMHGWNQDFNPATLDMPVPEGLGNEKVERTLEAMVEYARENDLPVAEEFKKKRKNEVKLPHGVIQAAADALGISRDTVERRLQWLRDNYSSADEVLKRMNLN